MGGAFFWVSRAESLPAQKSVAAPNEELPPAPRAELTRYQEDKGLAAAYIEQHRSELQAAGAVSDQEVADYYRAHQAALVRAPHFSARMLVVYKRGNPAFPERGLDPEEARLRAVEALGELRSGRSWEDVAARYSNDDATREHGGLVEDAEWIRYPREVQDAVRTQALSEPGDVFESRFGFHVVSVLERATEPEPIPLAEAREGILQELGQEKATSVGRDLFLELEKQTSVRVNEEAFPDSSLFDQTRVTPEMTVAWVGEKPVTELEFRAYLEDSVTPRQREVAYRRPHARREWLKSFLERLVLAEAARREGLEPLAAPAEP